MANRALDDKRAQALHLNKRITHKISRLRTKAEVEVAGTQYDVRANPKNIRRYTEKQLDAQIARASQFLDRGTQFVGDVHRKPIPASEWKDYKRAEQARRKNATDTYQRHKDIPLPGGTETIGQRRDKMRADRKLAGNPSVNDPYDTPVRDSKQIANRKAVKTLLREAKQKSGKGWDDKELKRQIGEFSTMVARIGDGDLAASVKKLTAGQFRTLWNDTNFAVAVSTQYELAQAGLVSDEDKPWHVQIIQDAFTDARRLVEWAKKLDL